MTARPTNASYFEQPHLNEFGYIIRLVPDDEPQPQPTAQNGKPHRPRLTVRTLDTYQTRAVEWLDKPFLQRSAFHVLAGRKGSCKGTYLCGLAARVTSGDLYPEPKRVLVVTSEDSIELDFRPRVLAAAGDPRLVTIVNGPFRMPADLDWLKRTALELGNVGLIIIDPIGNHLNGADTDKEGQVRDAIAPLNEIADELELMVFGVRHLGKDSSRGALASVLGSTAWVDVPRCVILMAPDDEDDRLYHAQVVAGNRGPRNAGRAFRLELVDVPPAREITLAVPQGESAKDVEALLAAVNGGSDGRGSKSAEARELTLLILETEGEQESDTLDARVAQEIGVAAKTVRNNRAKLKNDGLIVVFPERDEDGTLTRWLVKRTNAPRSSQCPTSENLAADLAQQGQNPTVPVESVCKGTGLPEPDCPDRRTGNEADDDIPF